MLHSHRFKVAHKTMKKEIHAYELTYNKNISRNSNKKSILNIVFGDFVLRIQQFEKICY